MPKPKTIAILLYDGVNALDVAGPAEAFAAVRREDGSHAYRLITLGLAAGSVRTESGLGLVAEAAADACAGAELLIVPGGAGVRAPETLAALGAWLHDQHARFGRIASVCTGAYVLAKSGLADGRTITTHWAHAADLARRYPKVTVTCDALFLADGRFYSSGGVTAGIDLALDIIEAECGPAAAMRAARELVVFLRRTGTQAQFSEPLKLQAPAAGDLSDVCIWAANNLGEDLNVERLAQRANLSVRQFTRRFSSEFGASPARYLRSLRLDAARAALIAPAGRLDRIAHASGFRSVDGFRRAFERRFGLCPTDYQRRFGRGGERA